MFVVITLIAQIQISSPRSHITVFNTSNVVHFGAVLLAAGILSAPWQALWPAGLLLGLAVLARVTYMLIVLWLARHRLSYQPVVSVDAGMKRIVRSKTASRITRKVKNRPGS